MYLESSTNLLVDATLHADGSAIARDGNTRELAASYDLREQMSQEGSSTESDGSAFRTTLIRVLIIQTVVLALLWLIQVRYNI